MIRKYGQKPYTIGLLHGGPGAAGEMKPVAINLSNNFGILELLQSKESVNEQIEELYNQLKSNGDLPIVLIGYSWGAWLGFLFTKKYPELVKKLILVSSGAFDEKYNNDLMNVRLSRLSKNEREEAENLISKLNSENVENETLKKFGKLMMIADSYDHFPIDKHLIDLDINMQIFKSVWEEASRLRKTKELISCAENIKCPVVAIQGVYDPHPIEGVEKPLSENLDDFKMIQIEKCGHTPWIERQAIDVFYNILREELNIS